MLVLMVDVGVMRVSVGQRLVLMPVGVRLAGRIVGAVLVLVVLVVDVPVVVRHPLMRVKMFVPLREVTVDANAHQSRGQQERECGPLV